MSTRLVLASTLALAAAGCAVPQPPTPIDLRAATGDPDVRPSGVTVDPAGVRFVFDEHRGLYQIGADGAFELIRAREAMAEAGGAVPPQFTDLVAIGPGRFAMAARGDGYVLDLGQGTLRPHFGHGADDVPEGYEQRTDAITYDPDAKLLYAQASTFGGGNLVASRVATYALDTGTAVEWSHVRRDVAAGGMAQVPGLGLLLGVGPALCALALDDVDEVIDLAPVGIVRIDGLAVDRAAGTLLVLDGDGAQLLELDLDQIR